MGNCLRGDVILVRYPFTDLSGSKIRPAVVVGLAHPSKDLIIVPLTSKTAFLLPGKFVMREWRTAGLNVETAVKRGIYTVKDSLVMKLVGHVAPTDLNDLNSSLLRWLGF